MYLLFAIPAIGFVFIFALSLASICDFRRPTPTPTAAPGPVFCNAEIEALHAMNVAEPQP